MSDWIFDLWTTSGRSRRIDCMDYFARILVVVLIAIGVIISVNAAAALLGLLASAPS